MKILLTDEAKNWYENKIPLNEGEAIRFFGKTYGNTEVHEGFSLGMQVDNPDNHDDVLSVTEENGRQYFTTKQDAWFFEGYDLEIRIDDQYGEPSYHFLPHDPKEAAAKVDAQSGATKKG